MRHLIRTFYFLLFATLLSTTVVQAKPNVLVLYAEQVSWGNDVVNKLNATGKFATVTGYDMRSTAPTVAFLKTFDAVLAFTDYVPASGSGNALAQYIDGGGGVVNATFSDYGAPFNIGESFNTSTYRVFTGSGIATGHVTLGTVLKPGHDIMQGVSSFDGGSSSYRNPNTGLESGAYMIANWSNGTGLIGARENVGAKNARRVDLNFFPVSSDIRSDFWQSNTDGAKIMANALIWVIGGPPAELAVTPKSMDFGTVKSGDSVTMCGTVKSVGTVTLKFTTVAVSGSSYFTYVSGPKAGDSLQAGTSAPFCVRFKPTNNGSFSGTLTFITNGRDSGTQSVALNGSGTAPVLSIPTKFLFKRNHTRLDDSSIACFQLYSIGTGPVRIDSVKLMGVNPDEYYISYKPSMQIPSGTSDSVCIGFRPNFEGRSDARVVVYSNASNLPTDTVALFGIGVLGRLVITPANISFDSVAIGDSVCKTVTLSNPGTDTLRIKRNYEASGDLDFIFTPVAHSDTVILPDHSILFNICFRPLQNGTRIARYRFRTDIPITYEQSRRDTGIFEINVTGIGVPSGRLAIGGATLDSAIIGQQVCQTDTIYNHGSDDLTITAASLSGADSSSFTATGVTFPLTIKAGRFAVLNVCSTPARRNLNTTSLLVTSTTGGKTETITVPLATKGLLVCASTTPPGLFTTSKTLVGAMDSAMFTVTNCGDVPAKYTVSLPAGTDYSIVPLTSATIAPGATATFNVMFMPTALGTRSSTATVTAPNGIPAMTVTLGGTGTGVTATATGEGDSVNKGDCKNFDVTITNNGNTNWTPGTGTISGGSHPTDFTIVSGPTPATIAPNGTAIVTIKFCPSTFEGENANLTFASASPMPITPFQYTLTASGRNSEGVTAQTEQNGFRLEQNYPNPSQRTTDIQFSTPGTANVTLTLLDNQGKLIKTLLTGVVGQGSHTVKLNVSELTSGNYLYILQTPQARLVRQMQIVK